MNNMTLTACDMVGPCGECGRVPERAYQFFVYGREMLLCGRCIATFVAQATSVLQKEEPQLAATTITLNAHNVSDLRCSRCLDMLAAYLAVYRKGESGHGEFSHGEKEYRHG